MKGIENVVESIRAASRTLFVLGVILIILGVLAVSVPWAAGLAVQALVGLFMIAAGFTWVIFSFHAHSWGSGLWEALVGVLATITGVLMLGHPIINLEVLTLIVAAYFISTGILKMVFAHRLKPLKSWGWVFFNGILSFLLGIMISYQWPWSGMYAIGILLGIDLMFGGFSLIQMGSVAERVLKK